MRITIIDTNVVNYIKKGDSVLEGQFKKFVNYFTSMKARQPSSSSHFSGEDKSIELPDIKPNRIVTFQEAMKSTLILGQVFALIPVNGVCSNNSSKVVFSLTSWKSIYSFLTLCGQVFMFVMTVIGVVLVNPSWKSSSPIIFFGTSTATTLMFYRMGACWPKLVQRISKIEELDPNFDGRLKLRTNITCFILVFFGLVEHVLSVLPSIINARYCFPLVALDSYEDFSKFYFPWIFNYFSYSTILALIAQYLQVQSTFTWNFSDVFVISMSYYLTSRLQQVNKKLIAARGKDLPESFWRSIREEYCRAAMAVRRIDDVIGGVVFISFANNLFFVCLQLFNSLENGLTGKLQCSNRIASHNSVSGYVKSAYYLFSLIALITRSVAVSLIAAQVNTASTVPASVLYEVPSTGYCTEVERFIQQVNGEKVALTGLQFFSITRGLLLTVAATIVTYELVMFQFNSTPTGVVQPTLAVILNETTTPMY